MISTRTKNKVEEVKQHKVKELEKKKSVLRGM